MGNDEYRASVHQAVHALLDDGLRSGIDAGGGLVHDQHRRIGHGRPRDGDQLTLSLGQPGSVAGQHRLVSLRQHADEAVRVGQLRRRDALLVGGVLASVADVLHDGAREEVHILQDDAERAPQVALADIDDIDTVVGDGAALDIVEAVQQVGYGRLSGAGMTHERDFLSGLRVEADVIQHLLVRHVAEIHVVQPDVSRQSPVLEGAVLLRDLPCPDIGQFRGLQQVLPGHVVLCPHEGDGAAVLFRLLVHQFEDAFRTGQRHDDRADLLADHVDGTVEVPAQLQEGDDGSDGHAAEAADGHGAAHDGEHGVLYVPHVHDHGHHQAGDEEGLSGGFAQRVVLIVERLDRLLFPVEDLDDLLSVDHLFHVSVQVAELRLLGDEIAAAQFSHFR